MKCDIVLIERYHSNELGKNERINFEKHLEICAYCKQELKSLDLLNDVLSSYLPIDINAGLLYSLKQIPHEPKKRFSIYSLLSRDFAISVLSIIFAFTSGAFLSSRVLHASNYHMTNGRDFFEQVSLTTLIADNSNWLFEE